MEISNQARARRIKKYFNFIVLAVIALAAYFLWIGEDMIIVFLGIGLVVLVILVMVVNFNYISFQSAKGKITLRYYPVITLFGREYNSIEFQHELLYKYDLKDSFLFRDLTLTVRTKAGIADYPPVSLTALNRNEIAAIGEELEKIRMQQKSVRLKEDHGKLSPKA